MYERDLNSQHIEAQLLQHSDRTPPPRLFPVTELGTKHEIRARNITWIQGIVCLHVAEGWAQVSESMNRISRPGGVGYVPGPIKHPDFFYSANVCTELLEANVPPILDPVALCMYEQRRRATA